MSVSIRTEKMNDVFSKVFVEGLPFPVIYHIFTGVETGDPHDHPFDIYVTVRSGWYEENIYHAEGYIVPVRRDTGDAFVVPAARIHQITAMAPEGCVTEVRYGPHKRISRFWQFRDDGPWSRAWNETEWTKELAL